MWTSVFSTIALLAAVAIQPPMENDPTLAAMGELALSQTGAPGIGIVLVEAGQVRVAVAGRREIGREVPVEVDDLWHTGSNTKAMTATLIARLVERGDVAWDDRIADHLGDAIPDMDPAYAHLTFRHLLAHRAGLPHGLSVAQLMRYGIASSDGVPLREQRLRVANSFLRNAPETPPETEYHYSNLGYIIAAAMVEQATGESWETLIQREVFEPLGMSSAGFGAPGSATEIDQPRGHRAGWFGQLSTVRPGRMADNPPVMAPAGTVHISLQDMARFLALHLDGARGQTTGYLTQESWDTLHTPAFGGDYAMGWGRRGSLLLHAGSNTMWFMQMAIDIENDSAFAVVFNDGRIDRLAPAAAEIGTRMARH